MNLSPTFLDHWKTRALIGSLNDPAAPLYIIAFWSYCQNREADEFPNMLPGELEAICRFPGHRGTLFAEMVRLKFVEVRNEGNGATTLIAHDFRKANKTLYAARLNGSKGGRPRNPRVNPRVSDENNPRVSGENKPTGFQTGQQDPQKDAKPENPRVSGENNPRVNPRVSDFPPSSLPSLPLPPIPPIPISPFSPNPTPIPPVGVVPVVGFAEDFKNEATHSQQSGVSASGVSQNLTPTPTPPSFQKNETPRRPGCENPHNKTAGCFGPIGCNFSWADCKARDGALAGESEEAYFSRCNVFGDGQPAAPSAAAIDEPPPFTLSSLADAFTPPPGDEETFAAFWTAYPQHGKASRKKAFKIWRTEKCSKKFEKIMAGLARWKTSQSWVRGFVHQATTFLNGDLWETEPLQANDPACTGFAGKLAPGSAQRRPEPDYSTLGPCPSVTPEALAATAAAREQAGATGPTLAQRIAARREAKAGQRPTKSAAPAATGAEGATTTTTTAAPALAA